jgi:hypothetical protein
MKHPHPSGRPIRERIPKKAYRPWFNYPPETFATPRLRPQPPKPVANAIGYKEITPDDERWQGVPWGFIDFEA